MKTTLRLFSAFLLVLASGCVSTSNSVRITEPTVVDASCGQCHFGLAGKQGCDLAVRIDGKSYFVDGFKMDQFGDTHADDGMCKVIRKARVTGEIRKNRFAASSFELLPAAN